MDNYGKKESKLIIRFLEDSHEKFKTVFVDSPIGILILDRIGQVIDINESGLKLFGFTEDKAHQESINIFKYLKLKNSDFELINNGEKFKSETKLDFDFIKNKKLKYINYIVTAIFSKDKENLRGYLVQIQDITKQVKYHKKLKQTNKQLSIKNMKMKDEIKKAKIIQDNLIPKEKFFKSRKEFNLSFFYSPIEEVGGDIYDVIRLNEHKYGFFIADVSGHGMPAALISSMMKIIINKHSKQNKPISKVFFDINNELYSLIGKINAFITAFYMTFDYENGIMEYIDAGHPPALYFNNIKNEIFELNTDGTIFGVFENQEYNNEEIELNKGDKILLYTDGIIEVPNSEKNMYKLSNLKSDFFKNISYAVSKDVLQRIIEILKDYAGDNFNKFDDKTMLCLSIDKIF